MSIFDFFSKKPRLGSNPYKTMSLMVEKGDVKSLVKVLEYGEDEQSSSSRLRETAIRSLGKIGGSKAIEALISALLDIEDLSSSDKISIAQELAKFGDSRATKPLCSMLKKEDDTTVCAWIAEALGGIGDENAVEDLVSLYQSSSNNNVREKILVALGSIGGNKTVEFLFDILKNNHDTKKRYYAVQALGEIKDDSAVEPIAFCMQNDNERANRREAVRQLGKVGSIKATKYLIEEFLKEDGLHYQPVCIELKKLRAEAFDEFFDLFNNRRHLIAKLVDAKHAKKEFIINSLVTVGSDEVIDSFINSLNVDEDPELLSFVVDALGKIGDMRVVEPLKKLFEGVDDTSDRRQLFLEVNDN